MALRFVRQTWTEWRSAVRDIVTALSSIMRDEDQANRWDVLAPPINASGSAPPTWTSSEAAWSFSPTTPNTLQGYAQMPHTWAEGTSVSPHLHLYYTGTASPGTTIQWRFRYRWFDIGSAVPAWTDVSLNAAVTAVAGASYITTLGQIAGTGKKIASLFAWEIARVGNGAGDTYSSEVFLSHFEIHILKARTRGSPRLLQLGYD